MEFIREPIALIIARRMDSNFGYNLCYYQPDLDTQAHLFQLWFGFADITFPVHNHCCFIIRQMTDNSLGRFFHFFHFYLVAIIILAELQPLAQSSHLLTRRKEGVDVRSELKLKHSARSSL